MKHVLFATPMRDRPTAHFMMSLQMLLLSELRQKYTLSFSPQYPISNLALSRCRLMQEAIDGEFDKLVFIDDDITFTDQHVEKLLEAEGEVVAAKYYTKNVHRRPVGYDLASVGLEPEEKGPLLGMACVGMGLTVIDLGFIRHVNELQELPSIPVFDETPAWFEFKVGLRADKKVAFLGEDEVFCNHVREHGGKVWLHKGVAVGHVGNYVY